MKQPNGITPRPGWKVLYYGAGVNDLQSSIKDAWASLEGHDKPDNVDLFVHHFDRDGKVQQAALSADGISVSPLSKESKNSGSENVFADFLERGMTGSSDQRVLLVVSSHGAGAPGVVTDEVTHDTLTGQELKSALEMAKSLNGGRGVDLVMFDACRMASLEMAGQLSGSAGLMVASMDNVGRSGFNLGSLLRAASENSEPEELAQALVQNDEPQQLAAFRTLCAVDLHKTEALGGALKSWNGVLESLDDNQKDMVKKLAGNSRRSINAPETQRTYDSIAEDLLAAYPVDRGLLQLWLDGTKPGPGVSLLSLVSNIANHNELAGQRPDLKEASLDLLAAHNQMVVSRRGTEPGSSDGLTLHFPLLNQEGPLLSEQDGPLAFQEQTAWESAYDSLLPEGESVDQEPTWLEKELAPFLN